MDVVWLILDSLSYGATSFAPNGTETTPELAAVAEERGIVHHEAYAPGPLSPSSHASFFTGHLPSFHGMHEAHPFFDGRTPTIADMVGGTHRTHLISVNNFLFTGLEQGFDETLNFTNNYLLFEDATDPREFALATDLDPGLARLWAFAMEGGRPLRSILNGLSYKFWTTFRGQEYLEDIPKFLGDDAEHYQYARTINDEVRAACQSGESTFVVANYMDVHPPLAPSDDALDAVAPHVDREELPVGIPTERTIPNAKKTYDVAAMYTLYRAAAWDLDRKVTPLVRELVEDGVFVVVTADHGLTFRNAPTSEERRRVPLVLFHPEEPPRTVERSVDLRALPYTTVKTVGGEPPQYDGHSLLSDDADDEIAITEVIYHATGEDGTGLLLNHDGTVPDNLFHDMALTKGEAKVVLAEGDAARACGPDATVAELLRVGEHLRERDLSGGDRIVDGYDGVTEKRLADLGYMDASE